jgi:cell division protease FtsH
LSIDQARGAVAEHRAVDKKAQITGWYIVAAVLAVLAIQQWWIEREQVETIPYSQFEEMIDAGKIQSVRVTDK